MTGSDQWCVTTGLAHGMETFPLFILFLTSGAQWNSAMIETWVQNIFVSYLPIQLLAYLVFLAGSCVNFVHVDVA